MIDDDTLESLATSWDDVGSPNGGDDWEDHYHGIAKDLARELRAARKVVEQVPNLVNLVTAEYCSHLTPPRPDQLRQNSPHGPHIPECYVGDAVQALAEYHATKARP